MDVAYGIYLLHFHLNSNQKFVSYHAGEKKVMEHYHVEQIKQFKKIVEE